MVTKKSFFYEIHLSENNCSSFFFYINLKIPPEPPPRIGWNTIIARMNRSWSNCVWHICIIYLRRFSITLKDLNGSMILHCRRSVTLRKILRSLMNCRSRSGISRIIAVIQFFSLVCIDIHYINERTPKSRLKETQGQG